MHGVLVEYYSVSCRMATLIFSFFFVIIFCYIFRCFYIYLFYFLFLFFKFNILFFQSASLQDICLNISFLFSLFLFFIIIFIIFYYFYYVVLNQISLVCKVYYKYRKQTLLQKYLDHNGCLERRHDFTKDPSRSQKHCFL